MRFLKDNPRYTIPFFLLGVCIAAFGLLIPFLGFYWDDWMTLYLAHTQDSYADYWYIAFRPLQAILDGFTYPLFGLKPLPWHVLSLATRWLAAVLAWQLVLRIWPRRREFAAWVGLLFAVYPSFFQQSSAVIYRHHWSSYALVLASLLFMLSPAKERSRRWLNLGLGLLSLAAGLLITEYMVGFEALRPVLLWLVITKEDGLAGSARWRALSERWGPYLLLGIAFFAWRTFGVDSVADPNPPELVFALADQPLGTLAEFLQAGIRDLVALLWTSWAEILKPEYIDFADRSRIFAWTVGLSAALGLFFGMRSLFGDEGEKGVEKKEWGGVALIGLLATLAGLATSWTIGRHITEGNLSDRFSIPAMLGASLLLSVLAFALLKSMKQRRIFLALLIGLAIAAHVRVSNQYRAEWVEQTRLAQQLVLRMPALEPGTTIVADGAATGSVTRYNAAFFINLLYWDNGAEQPQYWYEEFFTGLHRSVEEYGQGAPIEIDTLGIQFTGSTNETVMLAVDPGGSLCHWVLGPNDEANFAINEDFREVAEYSEWSRITNPEGKLRNPMRDLFGKESEPFWCSYFQKASLAHQFQDWERVVSLWAEAQELGLSAYHGQEYLPFIEALAAAGRWDEALELSVRAYRQDSQVQAMLCAAWERFEMANPQNEAAAGARAKLAEFFPCP